MPFSIHLYVSFVIIIATSSSLPLRHIGVEKNVVHPAVQNRELILCWVVQIKTNAHCSCGLEEEVEDTDCENDACDSREDGIEDQMGFNCCSGRRQIEEHAAALSEEVGLELQHIFGQFHDHFQLCHMDFSDVLVERASLQRNPPLLKSKSSTLSQIHLLHSSLKSRDKELFDRYKQEVEDRLRRHAEVLWFSSEHIHRRYSRSAVPHHLNVRKSKSSTRQGVIRSSSHIKNASSGITTPGNISWPATLVKKALSLSATVLVNDSDPLPSFDREDKFFVHLENEEHQRSNLLDLLTSLGGQDFHYRQLNKEASIDLFDEDALDGTPVFLSKRAVESPAFNDPFYPKQWHLLNRYKADMDINVTGVWQNNYTGFGITVSVVDDGIEWRNPDLKANYNSRGSWDMNDDDPDPTPNSNKMSNHHGTRCAGEIAAVANNSICGVGVAYSAQISGLRVLDGVMTDSMEAEAFNKKMDVNDIYSCSWGPDDDGKTVDGPHIMAAKAMKHGVDFGRRGYGSIFVVASGNGGENKDNCNFDGYANSIYTVTIGAVDEDGAMPYYAEECASMLGVTFSSGTKRDIVTTDWLVGTSEGCTEKHTGTSAAAPLAAAMIALMLEARPCLTWRDVQYIIILTSQEIDVDLAHWQKNGVGLSHSHKHGFGLLNSWRLVNAARVWEMVPWLTSYSYTESHLALMVPKSKNKGLSISHSVTDADIRGLSLFILENVQLTISLSHQFRGKIEVKLTSPAGTVSVLATPRPKDNSSDGFNDWTFTTVRCWGETATGNWTIQIFDYDERSTYKNGKLTKWRLTLFGTPMTSREFAKRRQLIQSAMSGQYLSRNYSFPCPPAPHYEEAYAPVSERTLKIIILSGAFCLIMAVYETLEYLLCYDDEKKEMACHRQLTRRAQQLVSRTRIVDGSDPNTSLLSNGATTHLPNDGTVEEEEDDDDDLTGISETSRLLRAVSREEAIPLSTFSISETNQIANENLPVVLDVCSINAEESVSKGKGETN